MDQWRGYWFDSLTDSQSVPRLMITCISITSLTGYTVWFVSTAVYIAYLPQLKAFLALDDLIRPLFSISLNMPTRHKYIWDNSKKKAFPKFFKEHVLDSLWIAVSKAIEITRDFSEFKILEDNSDGSGGDDWFSLVLLLHHPLKFILPVN